MAIINKHHIIYEGDYDLSDWVVPIKASWHKVLMSIQRTNPTPGQRDLLYNFVLSLNHELHRMEMELYRKTIDIEERE